MGPKYYELDGVIYIYSPNTVIAHQISQQGLLPNQHLSIENKEKIIIPIIPSERPPREGLG